MAALSHSESRLKYSWWWDSHISPKNSKWLQENLTDMDSKVKSMIKLIEEDADSFARRAEMYYKKRPELMKLVEEFYRAYRALAERYNHATCELRHAHRTIAKAFPDHQVPFELAEDSPSKTPIHSRDPRTPETKFPVRALFGDDDELLDELPESIENEGSIKLHEMTNNKGEVSQQSDCEVRALEKALSDMRVEKEDVLLNYQQCLAKLSNMEGELSNVQMESKMLDEKAGRAEIEVWTMKEALGQLKAENKDGSVKHEECLEKISNLEAMLFQIQDEAESDSRALKDEIINLEFKKEEVLCHRNECLGKISVLENVVSASEKEASLFEENAKIAENEISELKKDLADLNREKEASVQQYKCCLEKISNLEREICIAKEDVKRLNNDLLNENLKFKTAEKEYSLLEMTNLSLRNEAEDLSKKIANKDRELTEKQEELENLLARLVDEHSHHSQIEAALNSLQNLHSRSQDDLIALTLELEIVVRNLKDSEANKEILEEEIRQVRDENRSMAEFNVSCAYSMENMQNEILGLREIKERLEKEVSNHVGLSDTLHQEITRLKDEIKVLNESYQAVVEQVEAAGLSPKCFGPSIKSMQDENKLLLKKLEIAESVLKEKAISENYLLASSREEVKAMHESCVFLEGEKATLAAEKASLLSQLETITETMHKLLEKTDVLENSFSAAKVELGGFREKSKGLEEICELLKNERTFLLTERGALASKLENVERKLNNMEKRYNGLESKYSDLEKEKIAATCQVEELMVCLSAEKQERTNWKLQSDSKLAGLKNKIHFLQEENSWKNKEFEEELERSLKSQFEISILQKFMKEMEEKNCSLVIECQKHVEASKLADKLILGLESESLEQEVESKILLDEIEWLRLGVYRIFKALEIDPDCKEDKIENKKAFENRVLENIDDLKSSGLKHEDDKQVLLVENSVLLTLLEQLESKGMEIVSEKGFLEKEIKVMVEKLDMAEKEKEELSESNRKLKKDVNLRNQKIAVLEAEMENLREKESDLSKDYYALEEAYALANRAKEDITKKFYDLEEEKYLLDQLNDSALMEHIATASQSEILRVFSEEKVAELNLLLEDLKRETEANSVLEWKMGVLMEKFELQESENLLLKDCGDKLEREIVGMRGYNIETEERLLDTQAKLEAAENLNLKLCKTVNELESDIQESVRVKDNLEACIFQLSGNNAAQNLEIESLHMVKTGLESEVGQLREEIENRIIRERILSFELEEKNKEFGLWEAEASAFYFDLQISAVDGILYRDKLQELAGVHRVLEDENDLKNLEIEGMKARVCSMESEISGLKSQLCAYGPVVDTLRVDVSVLEHNVDTLRVDVSVLEHNVVLQSKLKSSYNHEPEVSEAAADPSRSSSEILLEDHSLISLQDLHMRIKVLGKLMQETNKPTLHRRSSSKKHREEHAIAADIGKSNRCLGRDKIKTKPSESRNPTVLMKDIPLDQISNTNTALPKRIRRRGSNNNSRAEGDQMLELWEKAAEAGSCESSFSMAEKDIIVYNPRPINSDPPSADSDIERELGVDKIDFLPRKSTENERRILDRLHSDTAKLENLQTTARIMREKMEVLNNKKSQNSKKDEELETVWEQFLEAEETIEYLVDLNGQLVRSIESCPSPDRKFSGNLKEAVRIRRKKVIEQARKGSERIGRLQLELQKIQYVLVKMEEEKSKGKSSKFFRGKTVVLNDFIYNGKKNSGKRKKGPMCGCFRRPSSRSESS